MASYENLLDFFYFFYHPFFIRLTMAYIRDVDKCSMTKRLREVPSIDS